MSKSYSGDKYMIVLVVALVIVAVAAVAMITLMSQKTPTKVDVTHIVDSSCEICSSEDVIVQVFEASGMVVGRETTVEYDSGEGQRLINNFGLQTVPAVVFSQDIIDYPNITGVLTRLNSSEIDGSYALSVRQPPFRNLSEGIVGLVDLAYINDSTCDQCYDVFLHRSILSINFGVFVDREVIIDVNSPLGKEFLNRYNITKIPTVIVSDDANVYPGLMQLWDGVGTIEEDGYMVFRNLTQLNAIYKNLETGRLVVST